MSQSEPKTVKVVLTASVTHAGTPRAADDTIAVTEPQKAWLEKHELIQSPKAKAKADPSTQES